MTSGPVDRSGAGVSHDAVYSCRCGARFVDDQIGYERHLFVEHDRLRDVLPTIAENTDSQKSRSL